MLKLSRKQQQQENTFCSVWAVKPNERYKRWSDECSFRTPNVFNKEYEVARRFLRKHN